MLAIKLAITIPFCTNSAPIAMPNIPVVNNRITASCALTITSSNEDDASTATPKEKWKYVARAIGSVLKGLNTNPMAGKNTGAA